MRIGKSLVTLARAFALFVVLFIAPFNWAPFNWAPFNFANVQQAEAAEKLGVALPYLNNRLEPLDYSDPVNQIVLANIAYSLTRISVSGSAELEAAEALQMLDGGRIWKVRLRPNLFFSNLAPAYPADIAASYTLLTDEKFAAAFGANKPLQFTVSASELASTFEASREITFVLPEPDSHFPLRLAQLPLFNPEIAKTFGQAFGLGTNTAFLAPYQVRDQRPDASLTLEAVPEFYRPGLPRTRFVEFRVFATATDAISALRVGGVDIIALPTPALLQDAAKDPTLLIIDSPLSKLKPEAQAWRPKRSYWSEDNESDALLTHSVILRKSLRIDDSLLARFDLSGTFLP